MIQPAPPPTFDFGSRAHQVLTHLRTAPRSRVCLRALCREPRLSYRGNDAGHRRAIKALAKADCIVRDDDGWVITGIGLRAAYAADMAHARAADPEQLQPIARAA